MTLPGIAVGDLNEPARILVENAQTLDAAGHAAPEIPGAGLSTALIADAIAALAQALSDLVGAQNAALLPGSTAKLAGQISSVGLPIPGKIGAKIPIAGVVFTGGQIAYDLQAAEDGGDVAKIVAKDAGGFLAGSAASALVLASFAGGPATVAAVGTGVLVSYGVGELIEWADS